MTDGPRIAESPAPAITEEMVAETPALAAAYYTQQLNLLRRGGAVWIHEDFSNPKNSGNALYFRHAIISGYISNRGEYFIAMAQSEDPDVLRSLLESERPYMGRWPSAEAARLAVEDAFAHPLPKS